MSIDTFRFHFPPLESVIVGERAELAVADLATQSRAKNILLLAARSLRESTDIVDTLVQALGQFNVLVSSGIRANTPRADVMEVIQLARIHNTELIISVGGGSIIDAGKIVQLALNSGISTAAELHQYAQQADGTRGAKVGTLLPLANGVRQIAIPTTLSGAEFSTSGSMLNEATATKEGYRAADLCPRAVIYDPRVALHTPAWLWLSTAIRSLDHAVEGYCSAQVHPYLEAQFLQAMRLFAQSLPEVKANPTALHGRSLNQQAAWLACAGLGRVKHGASHGIGYALSASSGVPHGYTSCVLLPAVLTWNEVINSERQKAIAVALGGGEKPAAELVKGLIKSLGLPGSLRELGVPQNHLPNIAKVAAGHSVVRANPRRISSAQEVMEILELAW